VLTAVRDATPEERKRSYVNVSGPEYFGLTNALVQELVQDLPGADTCHKYVRITFVASTKRHHGRGGRSAAGRAAADRRQLAAIAAAQCNVTEHAGSLGARPESVVIIAQKRLNHDDLNGDAVKADPIGGIGGQRNGVKGGGLGYKDIDGDDDDDDDVPIISNGDPAADASRIETPGVISMDGVKSGGGEGET
jgi:hypothetical protein